MAEPVVVTASAKPDGRFVLCGDGATNGQMVAPTGRVATAPLSWGDLTLMVRTGLTDDEVIAASAGKQLTTPIGPDEARQLRELGAGNRLIGYLQGQTVYAAPASTPVQRNNAQTRQAVVPPPSYVSAATPVPTVDYAARDRRVAALKKQIDTLDEEIRVARSRPNDYYRSGRYYNTYGDGTSRQQAADGYIKGLEDRRDELRREKWQLEGR